MERRNIEKYLVKESFRSMDLIDKVIEKLKDFTQKLIEALLGPQAEPEPELIPIPVRDRRTH